MESLNVSAQNANPMAACEEPLGNWQLSQINNHENNTLIKCESSSNQGLVSDKGAQKSDISSHIQHCKPEPVHTLSQSPFLQGSLPESVKEECGTSFQKPALQQITAVVHPLPSKPILSVCGKNRTRFSPTMVQFMEKHYQENKYPKADDYKLMASVLGLDWNKIKIWFQNRRSKERKENGKVSLSSEKEPEKKRRKLDSDNGVLSVEQKIMDSFAVAKLPQEGGTNAVRFPNHVQTTNVFTKVQDEVNHLTNQLCSSQINSQKFPVDNQPSMWQPFGGIMGNETQSMKDVKPPDVPPAGVLIPPVMQPMLVGMPSLYMLPPVTPIDLTKKIPDMNPFYNPRHVVPPYRVGQHTGGNYNAQNKPALVGNDFSLQQNTCALGQQLPLQQQKAELACSNDLIRYTQAGVNKPTEIYTQRKIKPSVQKQLQGKTPLQKLLMNDSLGQGYPKLQLKTVASDYDMRKINLNQPPQLLPISTSGYPAPFPPAHCEGKYPETENPSYSVAYPFHNTNSLAKRASSSFPIEVKNTMSSSTAWSNIMVKNKPLKSETGGNAEAYKTGPSNTMSYGLNTPANLLSNVDYQYQKNNSLNPDPDHILLQMTAHSTNSNPEEFTSGSVENKSFSIIQNSGPVIPVTNTVVEVRTQEDCFSSSLKYFENSGNNQLDSGIGASMNQFSDNFVPNRAATPQVSASLAKGDPMRINPSTYCSSISGTGSPLSPVLAQNPLTPSNSPPLCTSTPVKGNTPDLSTEEPGVRAEGVSPQNALKSPPCFDQLGTLNSGEFTVGTSQTYEFPIESSLTCSRQCDLNNNSVTKDLEKDYLQL